MRLLRPIRRLADERALADPRTRMKSPRYEVFERVRLVGIEIEEPEGNPPPFGPDHDRSRFDGDETTEFEIKVDPRSEEERRRDVAERDLFGRDLGPMPRTPELPRIEHHRGFAWRAVARRFGTDW